MYLLYFGSAIKTTYERLCIKGSAFLFNGKFFIDNNNYKKGGQVDVAFLCSRTWYGVKFDFNDIISLYKKMILSEDGLSLYITKYIL